MYRDYKIIGINFMERKEVIPLNTVKQRSETRKKEKEPEDVKNKQHGGK